MSSRPQQLSLPHIPSRASAQAEILERLVRIESKLTKLLLAQGLDEHGRPVRKNRARDTADA